MGEQCSCQHTPAGVAKERSHCQVPIQPPGTLSPRFPWAQDLGMVLAILIENLSRGSTCPELARGSVRVPRLHSWTGSSDSQRLPFCPWVCRLVHKPEEFYGSQKGLAQPQWSGTSLSLLCPCSACRQEAWRCQLPPVPLNKVLTPGLIATT